MVQLVTNIFALNSLEANKIAKFEVEHRCNGFHSDFVPHIVKLLSRITSKAAEFNNIPYPMLLNYWKKRISAVFQRLIVTYSTLERRLYNVIMI